MGIVAEMEELIPSTTPSQMPSRPLCKRLLRSEDLLGQERKVIILHGGEEYVLQVTKSGKLLLTK
ncbi:MAG: hemin uptake protein HemP [Planctomycetota bacterium]